ncbi:ankyrin repeat protein [Histomonas meleagridis]|uniref:ankyrin repeat protein n=1 Tax=Histomonas meleagridis TaxID=135588 RepID=UPI00355A371A|nr:ankyrin repeat protein [Histomonas meleagridis]KAH0796933.1 ankyrin repeat protein [Histomonas meleagridis]
MDSNTPFAVESVKKFLQQCVLILNTLHDYEGNPTVRQEIRNFLRTFHVDYSSDIISVILTSADPFRPRHTQALVDVLFDFLDPDRRELFAYTAVKNNIYFFFTCCDLGLFTADTVVDAFRLRFADDNSPQGDSMLVSPELEIIYGPEAYNKKLGLTPQEYQNLSRDCWMNFRSHRLYFGADDFDLALINDDINNARALFNPQKNFVTQHKVSIAGLPETQHPIVSAAILYRAYQVFEFLIGEYKLPINVRDAYGWGVLHSAAYVGNIQLFERLYQLGETNINGCLCAAICGRNIAMVDYLIQNCKLSVFEDHFYNLPAIWYAFEFRNYHVILDLYPMDQLKPDLDNFALFKPIYEECSAVAEPSNVVGYDGVRKLYVGNDGRYNKLVGFTGVDGKQYQNLPFIGDCLVTMCARKGYRDLIHLLYILKGTMSKVDGYGRDVFSYAAEQGFELIVAACMKLGLKSTNPDKTNREPLYYSSRNNFFLVNSVYYNVFKVIPDKYLGVAVQYQAKNVMIYTFRLMAQDPNVKVRAFDVYLRLAAEAHAAKALELLFDFGADIKGYKCKDPGDLHPLVIAAGNGDVECMRILLENRAWPDASHMVNPFKKVTAMQAAQESGNPAAVELLNLYKNTKEYKHKKTKKNLKKTEKVCKKVQKVCNFIQRLTEN